MPDESTIIVSDQKITSVNVKQQDGSYIEYPISVKADNVYNEDGQTLTQILQNLDNTGSGDDSTDDVFIIELATDGTLIKTPGEDVMAAIQQNKRFAIKPLTMTNMSLGPDLSPYSIFQNSIFLINIAIQQPDTNIQNDVQRIVLTLAQPNKWNFSTYDTVTFQATVYFWDQNNGWYQPTQSSNA